MQTARAADTSKSDFDIPECSPAEGIGAADEITGLRHVPLAALKKIYTDCRSSWKRVGGGSWPGAGATPVSRGGRFL